MPVSMTVRFIALGACGGTAFIDMYATQPLLPEFRHVFDASEAAVGLTVTATSFGCALAAPLVGSLADSIGRKRVIVSAILLLALMTYGAATATSLPVLIAWRAAQGALMPGVFAVALAYIAEEFPLSVTGSAVAAYVTGNVLGGFLGRYIAAIVAAHAPWQVAFVVLGTLNLIGAAFVIVALPASQNFHRNAAFGASGGVLLRLLQNRQVLATYAMGGAVLFTLVAAFTYVTFYLADPPFRLSTAAIGNVFVVYLLGLISTPLGGRLIDRLGNRAATLCSLVAAICGVLITLVPSVIAVIAGLALMSSAVFVMQTSSQGYLGRIVSENRSTAAAGYFTFYYVAGGLGAVIPAYAWTRGGWPATVALIVAVQVVVGALALFGWRGAPVPQRASG